MSRRPVTFCRTGYIECFLIDIIENWGKRNGGAILAGFKGPASMGRGGEGRGGQGMDGTGRSTCLPPRFGPGMGGG